MAGNVYVFNLTGADLNLTANGLQAGGTISGWSGPAGGYRPGSGVVPRTLNASDSPGKIFNGNNQLLLSWIDGLSGAQLRIDGAQFPLNQDALLLLERNQWQLVNQFGYTVATGEVTPMGFMAEATGPEGEGDRDLPPDRQQSSTPL